VECKKRMGVQKRSGVVENSFSCSPPIVQNRWSGDNASLAEAARSSVVWEIFFIFYSF
jgi:hypothetical protein